MSNLDVIFKILLPRGSLIISLSFPQALSTEFRVHWRGSMGRPEMESKPYEFLLHNKLHSTICIVLLSESVSRKAWL